MGSGSPAAPHSANCPMPIAPEIWFALASTDARIPRSPAPGTPLAATAIVTTTKRFGNSRHKSEGAKDHHDAVNFVNLDISVPRFCRQSRRKFRQAESLDDHKLNDPRDGTVFLAAPNQ